MKVLIMTLGTRGDVQPFIALARGLLVAGHEVVLAAPHRFAGFAAGHGVPFAGVDDGPMRLMDDPASAGALIEGGIRVRLRQARTMPAMFTQVLADCWSVASHGAGAGADAVVHNGQIIAGQHVAEALGVPAVLALPIPMYVPTREFAWPGVGLPTWLPAVVNRTTFLEMKAPAAIFGRIVDRWREDTLGLPRRRGRHDPLRRPDNDRAPVLHAFSPAVLPPPSDWPDAVHTTGYWILPSSEEPPPPQITDFLGAGDPPVFVGFGSMSGRHPARSTALVLEAARLAGKRLVISAGWGGLICTRRDGVLSVEEVDYQRLFPHMAAVVHHGAPAQPAPLSPPGVRNWCARSPPTSRSGPDWLTAAVSLPHHSRNATTSPQQVSLLPSPRPPQMPAWPAPPNSWAAVYVPRKGYRQRWLRWSVS